jgi:hypothetical protein
MIKREIVKDLKERFKNENRPFQGKISEAGAFIRNGELSFYVCYGGTNGDDIVKGYEKLLIYTEYLQLYQKGENSLDETADLIQSPLNRMIREYNERNK